MSDLSGSNKNKNVTDIKEISVAVEQCIERITQKVGFVTYDVNINDILANGGNYYSKLQTVRVKGRTKNDEREISLFIKNRIFTVNYKILSFDEAFKREAFFYNELVPIYYKLQDEANIPVNERFKVAKSYKESNSDVIILEDLSTKEYQTWHRMQPITFQSAKLSMKQLARYHALSHVLQNRDPEYFDKAIKSLNNLYNYDIDDLEIYLNKMCDIALESLDDDLKYRLEKYKPSAFGNRKEFMRVSEKEGTCLCHGDFRSNNVMTIKKDGEIEDVVIVDFQLIYFGCPLLDIFYYVFGNSDQEFRKEHLDELKEIYYETFQNFLKHFDISAQNVYPKERFEQEYRDNLPYGLSSFLILAPFILGGDEDIPDVQKGFTAINVNFNNTYKERLRGMVEDFIQWGHL